MGLGLFRSKIDHFGSAGAKSLSVDNNYLSQAFHRIDYL